MGINKSFTPVKTDFITEKSRVIYACDFETTTASWKEDETKVWAFCYDEVGKFNPEIKGSIEEFFDFCIDPQKGIKKLLYFHNLKFDGMFILYYLLNVRHFVTAIDQKTGTMQRPNKLINNECVYVIDHMGKWFYLAFTYNNITVEIRDSLKILPFTLKQIGESFCTKYKKSQMEYDDKFSLDDCSESDIEYIKNDVLVLSEALSFVMKKNGEETPFDPILSLTIGGTCYQQFKKTIYGDNKKVAVNLDSELLPPDSGSETMDEYIRKSYRGGYCYVNPKYKGKIINKEGFTADVNSLYPFEMCTNYSGNRFPIGKGKYCKGKPEEKYLTNDNYYFFIRFLTVFELKKGFVPTIQIKNSFIYKPNVYMRSTRLIDFKTEQEKGKLLEVELTLTKDDYILFLKHYDIKSIKYLDYIIFTTADHLFDEYIEKYAEIKRNSKGATRSLAKLFQNNLYGQMAKSSNSSYKVVKSVENGLVFEIVKDNSKKVVNIAIGSAITAKARFYQITTIQNNIERFCYSDTDSLHCIGKPEDFIGKIDDKEYGAYKIEGTWNRAIFLRQKTYIEDLIIPENQRKYCSNCKQHCNWNICGAGMTAEQKQVFRETHDFTDFKVGLTITGGKLRPVSVKGGVILEDADFTIL